MALQQNNQGPRGYGQPDKGMRRRVLRPEDEEVFGGRSPEQEDIRMDPSIGQGRPPSIYPQNQPQVQGNSFAGLWDQAAAQHQDRPTVAQAQQNPNWYQEQSQGYRNQAMPGRTPFYPNQNQNGGFNPQLPGQPQPTPGVPTGYQAQRPGTDGPVDPRVASPQSGYGWGGVQNPQYQANQQAQTTPQAGNLAQAAAQAAANGWTDIAGTEGFSAGPFVGSLEGFNVNGWGSGERGSNTLKNTFGKIASRYDPTQPGAAQQVLSDPDFKSLWPNATIVEHPNQDLIDFDGPGGEDPVDVLRAATAGGAGQAWQWGVKGGGGDVSQGPGGPAAQAYLAGMPQSQSTPLNNSGVPQVQDQNSAMDFLNWLMSQQNQGQLPQY